MQLQDDFPLKATFSSTNEKQRALIKTLKVSLIFHFSKEINEFFPFIGQIGPKLQAY